jgi:hypothetical protein
LLDGVYDGDLTIRELLRHGNFGLGTFNGLDGEMLVLDEVCYQLRADGSAKPGHPDELTPFAVVTWFHADDTFEVFAPCDRAALKTLVDDSHPNLRTRIVLRNAHARAELPARSRWTIAASRIEAHRAGAVALQAVEHTDPDAVVGGPVRGGAAGTHTLASRS